MSVGGNLSISEIVQAKDYALAEAARPAYGQWGLWLTVGFAIVATVSGLIASVFAVSRMLAMLTDMKLVPHSHFWNVWKCSEAHPDLHYSIGYAANNLF